MSRIEDAARLGVVGQEAIRLVDQERRLLHLHDAKDREAVAFALRKQ